MYKDEEGKFNGKVVRREKFVAWKFGGQRYDGRDQVLLLAEDKPRFKKSGRGDIPDSDSDYHNFAKNTACLRCGASRAGAAVVADSEDQSPSGKKKRKARKKPLSDGEFKVTNAEYHQGRPKLFGWGRLDMGEVGALSTIGIELVAQSCSFSATPVPSVGVVERLSNFYNEHIGPKNLEFAFVDSWDECAGRPWKKEGSDEDGVDMDDIKKQVELIAREFGNVRNVVHVDTVHDEMRLIFRIEFDSIDAAQRAIQSLRHTPVIRMFVNAPKAYSKRKDIPDVRIRTGRYPATDPTIELVRTRSQPQRRAHLQRDRNRNVERIYNAMVSGDHARDNPKSTARKRWIEEPHYQSDLWEIARGRTRKVTAYEW
ncbi:hypothetical protein J4E80_007862 [Alternaria sp. BMP 0032]|nr:hypothetical protein J4E80_007862 [Alternaria sp. BMP 0032]